MAPSIRSLLALGLVFAIPISSASAQPARTLPAVGVVETLRLPSSVAWRLDTRLGPAGAPTMEEYLPPGQTNKAWMQMLTIQYLPLATAPGEVVQNVVDSLRAICARVATLASNQGTQSNPAAAKDGLPDPYRVFDVMLHCDSPDMSKVRGGTTSLRKHEVIWFKGMLGIAGNYLVQRAWHGDKIDPASPLASAAEKQAWATWIAAVGLDLRKR